jgi:hypothetical protein
MKKIIAGFVFVTFLLMNCSPEQKPQRICTDQAMILDCKKVSFDDLIKSPDVFEGECIELEGYLNWQFEHVGFFKSKSISFRDGAVSLGLPDTIAKQINRHYPNGIREKISIKGVFNRVNFRFGFFGELNKVTCIEIK